jgi:hypothetical protein
MISIILKITSQLTIMLSPKKVRKNRNPLTNIVIQVITKIAKSTPPLANLIINNLNMNRIVEVSHLLTSNIYFKTKTKANSTWTITFNKVRATFHKRESKIIATTFVKFLQAILTKTTSQTIYQSKIDLCFTKLTS